MGISKAMAEKVMVASARTQRPGEAVFCATRYGNVMASRGSVKSKSKPASSTTPKPIFDEKLDAEIAKFFRQIAYRDLKEVHDKALRVLRNADRHLRRSANQLFKVLEQR
jgi:hypothetical protein